MSVREMLRQLTFCGYEVEVIGATIFDAESGLSALPEHWKKRLEKTDILELRDTPLVHKLLMTNSHQRDAMTAFEEAKWYEFYLHTLDSFKSDFFWFYGDRPFHHMIAEPCSTSIMMVHLIGCSLLKHGQISKASFNMAMMVIE